MKLRTFHQLLLLSLIALLLFTSCNTQPQNEELVIAISRERKTEGKKYGEWLAHQEPSLRFIDLSKVAYDAIRDSLALCDGLLLSGGEDIYPGLYGKEYDTLRCGTFNRERDAYEMLAFQLASEKAIPILGICRGMQFINVAMGGSLWIDLPEDLGTANTHRTGDEDWSEHIVTIMPSTLLASLHSSSSVMVASNHHQGIEKLAEGLIPAAFSNDMLIEAIQKPDPQIHYLLAVQWHPEWMDRSDTLSGKIAESFLKASREFNKNKNP